MDIKQKQAQIKITMQRNSINFQQNTKQKLNNDKMAAQEQQLIDSQSQQEQHGQQCDCRLCEKQRQIQLMKKSMRFKFNHTSLYQKSFTSSFSSSKSIKDFSKNKKTNKKQRNYQKKQAQNKVEIKKQRPEKYEQNISQLTPKKKQPSQLQKLLQKRQKKMILQHKKTPQSYLQLKSTYLKQFHSKKFQYSKFKPQNLIQLRKSSVPISTTYLQSYHSSLTPRPDSPMKAFQLPASNRKMSFKAESTYHNSYKAKTGRPSLPIIQHQNIHKAKHLTNFQSTQKESYKYLQNPERNQIIRPKNDITKLSAFLHNYETTYKNTYLSAQKKHKNNFSANLSAKKHSIDEIGNVYKRNKINRVSNKPQKVAMTIQYRRI